MTTFLTWTPRVGAAAAILRAVSALFLALTITGAALAQPAQTAAPALDVMGVWIDHTKRGAVEIAPCGQNVCGYIYWLKDGGVKNGKAVVDANNPDPVRRGKPICGTQILVNVAPKGTVRLGHVWGSTEAIYDPEQGKFFDVELQLVSPNELNVAAFVGVKLFGQQFKWTRAPNDLVRCGAARV